MFILKDKGDLILSGRYIGEILQKLVESILPTTFKENIKKIVEYLCSSKDEETKSYGMNICNIYVQKNIHDEKGDLFLLDIYKKFS